MWTQIRKRRYYEIESIHPSIKFISGNKAHKKLRIDKRKNTENRDIQSIKNTYVLLINYKTMLHNIIQYNAIQFKMWR